LVFEVPFNAPSTLYYQCTNHSSMGNTINILDGTNLSQLNVTGVTTVAAGTTAAPSISPTGDSNTGIFFPAADTIAFGEGGVEAFRITSTGQLRATGASDVRFTLGSTGTPETNNSVHIRADGADLKFMNASGGITLFEQNGTERMRIDSSGRLGIGFTPKSLNANVTSSLNVGSSSLFQRTKESFFSSNFYYNSSDIGKSIASGYAPMYQQDVTNGAHIWYHTGNASAADETVSLSEKMRIDSSGRLLVGTSTSRIVEDFAGNGPQSLIQIEAANSNAIMSIISAGTADASRGGTLNLGRHRNATVGGTPTVVQSGDLLGAICFAGGDGTDLRTKGASIACQVDGTPDANDMPGRLVFATTADGASSPTERVKIQSDGTFNVYSAYNLTTANAANVHVLSGGALYRSTSSSKYKTEVETLQDSYADALLNVRPVWYRSTCAPDDPTHSYWGFLAEEVAAIDPRLVQWKTVQITYDEKGSAVETPCDPEPEGVQYDRFVPHLLNLIKRQKEQIEAMEARLSALEAQ